MKTTLGVIFALLSLSASAQSPFGRSAVGGKVQQLGELTGSQPYALVANVAISGNTLVLGAPVANSSDGCFECGTAYVYTAVNGDWSNLQLTATLAQSSGQAEGGFGGAVAVSGDTIVVGGYDSAALTGAAYIYINPSGTVTENAELTTSGAPSGGFNSVAIDGGTIVAGSPLASVGTQTELGAAYVYVEPSGGWVNMTQTAQLGAKNQSVGCYFGDAVGISGRIVVVGSPRSQVNGLVQRGRAYVFVEPGGGWAGTQGQTTEIEPSDGVRKAFFGSSVSVSGSNVAAGAPEQSVGSSQNQGVVYVYTEPSTGWPKTMTETAEITARDGKAGNELGAAVVISGRTLLAGAPGVRNSQGVAYVFGEPSGGWRTGPGGQAISASDGAPNNDFGISVGLAGRILAISAPGWPSGVPNNDGAVYVYGPTQ